MKRMLRGRKKSGKKKAGRKKRQVGEKKGKLSWRVFSVS